MDRGGEGDLGHRPPPPPRRRRARARIASRSRETPNPTNPRRVAAGRRGGGGGRRWVLVLPVGRVLPRRDQWRCSGAASPSGRGRRRPAASPLPSPPRAPPLASSASATAAALAAADDGAKMKGLFKSKPRTPADVVRQTRELLIFLDLHSGSRGGDAKREEKVRSNTQLLLFFFAAPSPLLRTFVPDRS